MIIATGSPTKRTRSRASSRRPGLESGCPAALFTGIAQRRSPSPSRACPRSDDGEHTGHCDRVGSINAEDLGVRVRRSEHYGMSLAGQVDVRRIPAGAGEETMILAARGTDWLRPKRPITISSSTRCAGCGDPQIRVIPRCAASQLQTALPGSASVETLSTVKRHPLRSLDQ